MRSIRTRPTIATKSILNVIKTLFTILEEPWAFGWSAGPTAILELTNQPTLPSKEETKMRKYLFELEIEEGNSEFWEEIKGKNVTGCEQLVDILEKALETVGFTTIGEYQNCKLNLFRYSNN